MNSYTTLTPLSQVSRELVVACPDTYQAKLASLHQPAVAAYHGVKAAAAAAAAADKSGD